MSFWMRTTGRSQLVEVIRLSAEAADHEMGFVVGHCSIIYIYMIYTYDMYTRWFIKSESGKPNSINFPQFQMK